jgi:hypothetical protein
MRDIYSAHPAHLFAELQAANTVSVNAELLPRSGPDFVELINNRERWLRGERITPVALNVGKITLGSEVQDSLREVLAGGDYRPLLGTGFYIKDLSSKLKGQAGIVYLLHEQVRRLALLDSIRRGIRQPEVSFIYTQGGYYTGTVAEKPHVDDKTACRTRLRYILTGLGHLTGFSTDEVSIDDIKDSIYLTDQKVAAMSLETALADSETYLTMFELHTPHWAPPDSGDIRFNSTLTTDESADRKY